jgi:hypothetical protein
MSAIIRETISGASVEVYTFDKGNGAFVFVDDEFAGSVERDAMLQTWTSVPLYRRAISAPADGMWSAVRAVIHAHIDSCVKAALAR